MAAATTTIAVAALAASADIGTGIAIKSVCAALEHCQTVARLAKSLTQREAVDWSFEDFHRALRDRDVVGTVDFVSALLCDWKTTDASKLKHNRSWQLYVRQLEESLEAIRGALAKAEAAQAYNRSCWFSWRKQASAAHVDALQVEMTVLKDRLSRKPLLE